MPTEHYVSPERKLRELADEFHHIKTDLRNEGVEGGVRRRETEKMHAVERRFERLLNHWIQDPAQREQWLGFLHGGVPAPAARSWPAPLLFKGRSEDGSTVEIREGNDGMCELYFNGTLDRRFRGSLDLQGKKPARVILHNQTFQEVFDVSEDAKAALLSYVDDPGREPAWEHAPELYMTGLIDIHFALTERGKRFASAS